MEQCLNAIATSRTDESTRHLLFEAAGVLGGLAHNPRLIRYFLPEGIMLESAFVQLYMEEAKEKGRIDATIDSILALLSLQFHPDAVQALKPTLEKIDDVQRLQQLHLAAARPESLEAFMQNLSK